MHFVGSIRLALDCKEMVLIQKKKKKQKKALLFFLAPHVKLCVLYLCNIPTGITLSLFMCVLY